MMAEELWNVKMLDALQERNDTQGVKMGKRFFLLLVFQVTISLPA